MGKVAITILIIGFFISLGYSKADPLFLENGKEYYKLGLHLDILEDPTKKLTIHDVNNEEWAKKFVTSKEEVPNFGFSKSAFWVRLKIKNKSQHKKWFLSQNYYYHDEVILFKKVQGHWKSKKTGDMYPFSTREVDVRPITFSINPGEEDLYFLRVQGSINQLQLSLATPTKFSIDENRETYALGLFFGLVLSMVAYNAFIFFSTGSSSYLYYVLYVFFYGLFLAHFNGFTQIHLFRDLPWMNNNGTLLWVGGTSLFLSFFTINFLGLRDSTPKIYKIFIFLSFTSFLVMLSSIIFPFYINIRIYTIHSLLALPIIFYTAIYRVKMNYRPAKYYLFAFSLMILGTFTMTLIPFDIIPSNAFTNKAGLLGNALELIFLSMGLADKFNLIQEESLQKEIEYTRKLKMSSLKEKETYRQLQIVHNQLLVANEGLETKVEERTIELNKSLNQLKSFTEERSNFFAKLSHELRTPLNSILGFSNILLEESGKGLEFNKYTKDEYLNCVISSGNTLLGLINEVHDITKLDLGKLKINYNSFSLKNLLNNISTYLISECEKKGLLFYFKMDESLPTNIILDELRLKQVLSNLLENALKFTDDGFISLKVSSQTSGDKVDLKFVIEDSGPGINDKEIGLIFDEFYSNSREKEKSDKATFSSGIGLYITKKLVEKMEGQIFVKSKPKKGTTFEITLKDVKPDRKEVEEGKIKLSYDFLSNRILIADDHEQNIKLLKAYLSESNLIIEVATNGPELVEKATNLLPKLILTDVKMPIYGGHEALKGLRKKDETKNIPIVGISAISLHEDVKKEFSDFLNKPVSKETIIKTLKKYLGYKEVEASSLDKKPEALFTLKSDLESKETDILIQMRKHFKKGLELQDITDIETYCSKLKNEIKNTKLEYLNKWLDQIILKANTFEIDYINRILKGAIKAIDKFLEDK
ncbi:MAG: 7TM diverse intracellular signaling domain-containing protein [Bdellovibrionota bacterium]|nr:7TM diverse intracellular signaling domain-containing protein [Bdellovibrionota bacterium]